MADNSQDYLFPDSRLPVSDKSLEGLAGFKYTLALGAAGAGAAALLILGHLGIAVIGAVLVLVLAAAESEPFLLVIIFLIPLGWSLKIEGRVHDVPSAVRSLVFVGFFVSRLWRGRLSARELLRSSPARASILFLSATIASIILAQGGWTQYSMNSLYRTGSYLGFFFVVLAWADSPVKIRKILSLLLYSTIITAVFAICQEVMGGYTSLWLYLNPPIDFNPQWNGRTTSFLNYSNSLAGYLNLILPFALACYVRGQGKWKTLGAWTLGLGFLAMLTTQSVGGLVAFVAILILGIFCFARNRTKSLVLFASICAFAGLLYLSKQYLNPTHTEESIGPDTVMRVLLWGTAWGYFVHSPIIGVGWGNFVGLYGLDLSSFSDLVPQGVFEVHNIYLQLLAETGLVGFMAFSYLFIQSWRLARSQLRSSFDSLNGALAFGVLGALLSVLVHGFVDFLFLVSPQFGTVFWVLLALLVASARLQGKTAVAESQIERVG